MKEKKHIQKRESLEEIRRRERRLLRREWAVKISKECQQARQKGKDEAAAAFSLTRKLLKENSKKKMPVKKPGAGTFLAAFSFIPATPYDMRDNVPASYTPRSFNERRQYVDFLKTFIYPYAVPHSLLWASFEKEKYMDERGAPQNVPYSKIISLSKKWICDITSGESFYRKNKAYFTRAEVHHFLNTALSYNGPSSILKLYYTAKCRALNIDIKRSAIIADVFTIKFADDWDSDIVNGFIGLLGRSLEYRIDAGTLGDVCDFILTKINAYKKGRGQIPVFSFSGRTMGSITALANEWHADLQKEQEFTEARAGARNARHGSSILKSKIKLSWQGIDVPLFNYETDEYIWKIKQLLNAQALLNEGRTMRNCVASYTSRCVAGNATIFNVSCFSPEIEHSASCATLEVDRGRTLVQAKGKCNGRVPPAAVKAIRKWAEANRISVGQHTL